MRKSRIQASAFTKEKRKEIATQYSEGKTVPELAALYGVSATFTLRCVQSNGVAIRPKTSRVKKLSLEQKDALINDYKSGLSTLQIAERYGIRRCSAWELLKNRGLTRPLRDARRQYRINQFAFDYLTDDAAYWVGFLLADGCMAKRGKGSYLIKLSLSSADAAQVENFRSFLQAEHPIKHTSADANEWRGRVPMTTFSACCPLRLANRLMELGVVPRKTFTATAHESLASNLHFWRGLIDGDGTVCFTQNKQFMRPILSLVSANLHLIEQFETFCRSIVPSFKTKPRFAKGVYYLQLTGIYAIHLSNHLYPVGCTALERKSKTAATFRSLLEANPMLYSPFQKRKPHSAATKQLMRAKRLAWWDRSGLRRSRSGISEPASGAAAAASCSASPAA